MTHPQHSLADHSCRGLLIAALAVVLISAAPGTPPVTKPGQAAGTNKKPKKKTGSLKSLAAKPLPLEQARQRAQLLHDIYESTLLTMHRHYFEPDKQRVIQSRALEDVFYTGRRRWGVEARWLAVSAQAMNIDHKAKTVFEKAAVRVVATGMTRHEEGRDGT